MPEKLRKRMSWTEQDDTAKTTGRDRRGEDLQMYAVTLLLCAPSELHELWITTDDEDAWQQAVADLGVGDPARAVILMRELSHRKPFFAGIAGLLRDTGEYAEPPPHPKPTTASELIARLR